MFFLPLFLALFVGILLKYLIPFLLSLAGFRDGTRLDLGERLGPMLFLICSAILAGFAYWYPWYLCTYHASEDDRYGLALLGAFPFYFIGAGISGVAFYRLMRAVARRKRGVDVAIAISGGVLALVGFSPLLMLGWRILTVR